MPQATEENDAMEPEPQTPANIEEPAPKIDPKAQAREDGREDRDPKRRFSSFQERCIVRAGSLLQRFLGPLAER